MCNKCGENVLCTLESKIRFGDMIHLCPCKNCLVKIMCKEKCDLLDVYCKIFNKSTQQLNLSTFGYKVGYKVSNFTWSIS